MAPALLLLAFVRSRFPCPLDEGAKEAVDDEALGVRLAEASGAQVVELLGVHLSDGRGVGAANVVGLDLEPGDGIRVGAVYDTAIVSNLASLHVAPHFVIHHRYPQNPGNECDDLLLQAGSGIEADASEMAAASAIGPAQWSLSSSKPSRVD